MINLLRRLKYLSKVAFTDKFLLPTNCVISVTLSSVRKKSIKVSKFEVKIEFETSLQVGDVIEQQLEIYKKEIDKWDRIRTRNMATSGLTVGVFCHYWYKLLDARLPGRTFGIVAKKVLVDQLIASPIVIAMFFATLGVMRRESLEETMEEIRHKFLRLYKAEWIGELIMTRLNLSSNN